MNKTLKITILISLCLLFTEATPIREEVITKEELNQRIKAFNEFFHKQIPSTQNLEVVLDQEGATKLKTTKDLKQGETYLVITKDQMIFSDHIYSTKYGDAMREIEEMYGYDDMVNFALAILAEKFNPESKWKAYIDTLPPKPINLVADFWGIRTQIEPYLKGTSLLRKTLEYKLLLENKSKGVFGTIIEAYDVFDNEQFSTENIEWALATIDNRVIFAGFEAFLVPLVDSITYGESTEDKTRTFSPSVTEDKTLTFTAMDNFKSGSFIIENARFPNDKLLMSYGQLVQNKKNDCYKVSLSFTENKDDPLAKERSEFYGKYFLYDMNHHDLVEDCISPEFPFNRKILFFFYTLMMDETDLKQTDPKRVGLEDDRIILEFSIGQLRSILHSAGESPNALIVKASTEKELMVKYSILYRAEQLSILTKVIGIYEDNYMMLLKEDSL